MTRTDALRLYIEPRWITCIKTVTHAQAHLEVINLDLVLVGVALSQRFEDSSMVAFGLQQLTKFL